MLQIKTGLLQPGMVVASDVRNMDSMLLIPAGTQLTDRQINILLAWGVEQVNVQPTGAAIKALSLGASLTADELCKITSDLEARFWKPDKSDPVFHEIFKLMLHRSIARHSAAKRL